MLSSLLEEMRPPSKANHSLTELTLQKEELWINN